MNGALANGRQVEAGPFVIPDIPVASGSGTVMLAYATCWAASSTSSSAFLTTPLLLLVGMTAHVVEIGKLRGQDRPSGTYSSTITITVDFQPRTRVPPAAATRDESSA